MALSAVASGARFIRKFTAVGGEANIDFLSDFSALFDHYMVVISGMRYSGSSNAWLKAAVAGAVDAGANLWVPAAGAAAATAPIEGQAQSTLTGGKGLHATLMFLNVNSTTTAKVITAQGMVHQDATPTYNEVNWRYFYLALTAMSGFRLTPNVGTFSAGASVYLYGLPNS